MKHELNDAVEATAQAIEERVSETNIDPKARAHSSHFIEWLLRCFSVFETVQHRRGRWFVMRSSIDGWREGKQYGIGSPESKFDGGHRCLSNLSSTGTTRSVHIQPGYAVSEENKQGILSLTIKDRAVLYAAICRLFEMADYLCQPTSATSWEKRFSFYSP